MTLDEKIRSLVGQDTIVFKDSKEGNILLENIQKYDSKIFDNKLLINKFTKNTFLYMQGLYRFTKCIQPELIVELGVRESYSSVSFLEGLRGTTGRLISFDPQFIGNPLLTDTLKSKWTYYPLYDYEGFDKFSLYITNIDVLYIDIDPHDREGTSKVLREGFITNIKRDGYILLDDTAPQHQQEVNNRYNNLFDVGAKYGVLSSILVFIEEYSDSIEFAFSINNKDSNGLTIIKYKKL